MTDQNINDSLQQLQDELNELRNVDTKMKSRAGGLRQRIDEFINGDPDNDDWNGLREEMLEMETYLVETNPRLAAALRSIVAIVDNAGL